MPLRHKQGDTFLLALSRTDEDGNAVSLSGISILSQLRLGSTVLTLTPSITSEAQGQFTLSATAEQTAAIRSGAYYFDVQFTDADGNVTSSETDMVTIEPDVSRVS